MAGIKIRLQKGEETAGDIAEAKTPQKQNEKFSAMSLFATIAERNIRNVLSTAINDYGKFTGNTQSQRDLQNIMSIVGDVESIGFAIATGNPAVIGVAVVGMGVSKSITAINYALTNNMQEKQTSFIMQRSGNNLVNGGRGTND